MYSVACDLIWKYEVGHLNWSLNEISTALLLSVLFIELILTKKLVLVGGEC